MHGPTFMANPLACSIALASLDLLETQRLARRRPRPLQAGLATGLAPARGLGSVADVRVLGGRRRHPAARAGPHAPRSPPRRSSAGVWVRPFRDLVYTMPPYVTGERDLATPSATRSSAPWPRCTDDRPPESS